MCSVVNARHCYDVTGRAGLLLPADWRVADSLPPAADCLIGQERFFVDMPMGQVQEQLDLFVTLYYILARRHWTLCACLHMLILHALPLYCLLFAVHLPMRDT